MTTSSRSLLAIEPMEPKQIVSLLRLAKRMHYEKPRNILRGRRVVLLFYEASTRTRVSFEFAAKALGATTAVVSATASSIEKGESLLDTGATLRALGADAIVIRHPSSGAPGLLARNLDIPIINAGDGMHEHPSQGLLDAFTILEHKGDLHGLRVTIVGDVFHSRVARSDVHLLSKFGAKITLCGPPALVPDNALALAPGIRISQNLDESLHGADVVILLRVQKERLQGLELDVHEYTVNYQLTRERLRLARRGVIVLHPGPIMRGMELTDDIADGSQNVILDQVRNGVSVRMAILAYALGGAR
ncbi:MAG TPA: aspartate carbamoyltransferase catalytic subunit [Clostridia bacterium]|nr:aspartate carbamoyltransferase catalytic subunit [Clostridia bacterium]